MPENAPETRLLPPAFLPPPAPVTGADGSRRYEGVTYARTSGYRPRLLDVHRPPRAEPVPAVIWIHGGGWLDGDRRYPPSTLPAELLFGSILRAGLAAVTIDYRHSLEAVFPAQLHDVRAAIRYVRHFAGELGIDPERIGVWGESAGGHLAALAALAPTDLHLEGQEGVTTGSSAVRAVVDWYGVSDLRAASAAYPAIFRSLPVPEPWTTLLGARPEDRPDLARAASPVTYADRPGPPFLLIHGTADQVCPYAQSELLATHLAAHGTVELVPVPGADHILLGAPDIEPLVARSVSFLVEHLG